VVFLRPDPAPAEDPAAVAEPAVAEPAGPAVAEPGAEAPAPGEVVAVDLTSSLWQAWVAATVDDGGTTVGPATTQMTFLLSPDQVDRVSRFGGALKIQWRLGQYSPAANTWSEINGERDLAPGQTEVTVDIDNMATVAGADVDVVVRVMSYEPAPATVSYEIQAVVPYSADNSNLAATLDCRGGSVVYDTTDYQDEVPVKVAARWGQTLEFAVPEGTLPEGSTLQDGTVGFYLTPTTSYTGSEWVYLPATVTPDGKVRLTLPSGTPFSDGAPTAGATWMAQAYVAFTGGDPGSAAANDGMGPRVAYTAYIDVTG
jgi:hypothetical protein